jgi:hypothetical protein
VRWLVALAALVAGSAQACLPGPPAASARRVQAGDAAIEFRPDPGIIVGEPFTLDVRACDGLRLVRVDAEMPEHRHGMNYVPSIRPLGQSRFRAEGLLFHMPGRWQLTFELKGGDGVPHRLTTDVTLE